MPSKGKAVDRRPPQPSESRSSSAKRKIPATCPEPAESSTPPKKSKPSPAELGSSQGSHLTDAAASELLKTPVKEDCKAGNTTGDPSPRPASRTFAEMYQFASRTQSNGVIDLTQVKPMPMNGKPLNSKPLNGLRGLGSLGQAGPKKLVVKNLRAAPKVDPQEYLERKWREQVAALNSVFAGGDVKILLEELYKATEHICRQGRAAELFKRLKEKCTTHLDQTVRPKLVQLCQTQPGTLALQAFVDAWSLWQRQLQTIRHIYFYLNQSYLIKHPELGDINQVGMQLFRSVIFNQDEIRHVALEASVELVQQHRNGDVSRAALLKAAIDTLHALVVYTTDFEPMLIQASRKWFRQWREEEAEKDDLPHYVRSCSSLREAELARCDTLSLDRSTRTQLTEMFDDIFIEENVERLTDEDGVLDMLEGNMDAEVEQCWTLLSRKGHQHLLSAPYGKFTETEGALIVFDEKREAEMVIRLLELKRKLDHLHVDCFHKNETMGNTLHKSFETFINKSKKSQSNWDTDNPKAGEMIAKHIDLLLKGGVKAIPQLAQKQDQAEGDHDADFDDNEAEEESVEKHLADALDLFRFVQGKDVFEAFYKKDFARRLLMGRTQSFDAERSMLNRLRNECGADFTRNLENMFKDMDLAREEMKSYSQILSDKGIKPAVELNVSVLSIAAWPTYADVPVNLPTSILKAQHDFEKHYKDKHVGRKLTWKPSLAHCQLKARFAKGVKELVVSGFQAIILLLFNDVPDGESLSYERIKSATNLPDAEVKRTLQSLACAKFKVLTKSPKGRDVNETDSFTYNEKFTDSRFRVKINQIQLKETKEENKATHKRVAEDRHYETQAAIVRIMKSRKKIGHNELIVEVIKATRKRGVLDQADIKKNIEKLIEKDYMEREDEIKGYSYLA